MGGGGGGGGGIILLKVAAQEKMSSRGRYNVSIPLLTTWGTVGGPINSFFCFY